MPFPPEMKISLSFKNIIPDFLYLIRSGPVSILVYLNSGENKSIESNVSSLMNLPK